MIIAALPLYYLPFTDMSTSDFPRELGDCCDVWSSCFSSAWWRWSDLHFMSAFSGRLPFLQHGMEIGWIPLLGRFGHARSSVICVQQSPPQPPYSGGKIENVHQLPRALVRHRLDTPQHIIHIGPHACHVTQDASRICRVAFS